MMYETSSGIRIEVHGDPRTGGLALYDSRDGRITGVIVFDTLHAEIGSPVRYTWEGCDLELELGRIVNSLVIRHAA